VWVIAVTLRQLGGKRMTKKSKDQGKSAAGRIDWTLVLVALVHELPRIIAALSLWTSCGLTVS
jgi:hypothetical protein